MCYSLSHEGLSLSQEDLSHSYAPVGEKQMEEVGEGLTICYSLTVTKVFVVKVFVITVPYWRETSGRSWRGFSDLLQFLS
ncbi:unnamed protein product [Staurois parvus]|uniref:Uncharacterized protein n=1 Tax=Staurois parvus TaxID=386267 RepID=A0ABN9E8N3_9NEOB|nr:unnamed protein product [Staurois parvus]